MFYLLSSNMYEWFPFNFLQIEGNRKNLCITLSREMWVIRFMHGMTELKWLSMNALKNNISSINVSGVVSFKSSWVGYMRVF